MSIIPTAPDLKNEIAETIRARRKATASDSRYSGRSVDRDEAGRFTTLGDALVTVEALVTLNPTRILSGPDYGSWEQRLEVGAVAKCHGHGCADPEFRMDISSYFLLSEDADKTAEYALPYVQKAREWAQAHAEKCRAQAYNG